MVGGEEYPFTQPRVDGVQVGGVGCARPHMEARIAAQDVEAARAHHEAGAGERGRGPAHAAERRARLGYGAVNLETEVVGEEVAEEATCAEQVEGLEASGLPTIAAEPADRERTVRPLTP